jgi:glutamine cyclotransferase
MKQILSILSLIVLLSACNNSTDKKDPEVAPPSYGIAAPVQISYNIIAQHPHDTSAYTQGLQLYNGKMYEGTGDFETSSLRITDYKTGKVEKNI